MNDSGKKLLHKGYLGTVADASSFFARCLWTQSILPVTLRLGLDIRQLDESWISEFEQV